MLAPRINLRQIPVDREIGRLLPEAVARQIHGVCIGRLDERTLNVAVVDVLEVVHNALIETGTPQRFRAHFVAADPESVRLALDFIYAPAGGAENWKSWLESKSLMAATVLLPPPVPAPRVEMPKGDESGDRWERILKEATTWKCSHIHLETVLNKVRVRLRQDGWLRTFDEMPRLPQGQALVQQLKALDPQESGRVRFRVVDQDIDLSVASVGVPGGENWVLTFLQKPQQQLILDQLGLGPEALDSFQRMVRQPYGMVLACGPNGSGKTTTLYACLKSLVRPERKLVSVEDPIEYALEGVTQVQVDPRRGISFGTLVGRLLCQDPEVLMVGELRDHETTELSLQACEEGHLVLSSLRANDTLGMITRLLDLGFSPRRLAANLLGGSSQRLVRRNCTFCQQVVQPTPDQEAMLRRQGLSQWHLRKGSGCPNCQRQGHRGRVGLFEVLRMTGEMRGLLEGGATVTALQEAARQAGAWQSLLQEGVSKAAQGIIPVEEVERVCLDPDRR